MREKLQLFLYTRQPTPLFVGDILAMSLETEENGEDEFDFIRFDSGDEK